MLKLPSLRELHFSAIYMPDYPDNNTDPEPPPTPSTSDSSPPQRPTAKITGDGRTYPASIAFVISHSRRLADLKLHHPALFDADLTSALQPLTRLRSLDVDSAALDGLSFASTATHLADTLERLRLRRPRTVNVTLVVSELQHLHALTNLRTLEVDLGVVDPRLDDTDEFDMSKPAFRRDRWPHLLASSTDTQPRDPSAGRIKHDVCYR